MIKLKDNLPINIIDVYILNKLYNKYIKTYLLNKPDTYNLIKNLINLKINLPNENLNLINSYYMSYVEDNDIIRKHLYDLFSYLCSMKNNDGLVRHVIMFSKSKIRNLMENHYKNIE